MVLPYHRPAETDRVRLFGQPSVRFRPYSYSRGRISKSYLQGAVSSFSAPARFRRVTRLGLGLGLILAKRYTFWENGKPKKLTE